MAKRLYHQDSFVIRLRPLYQYLIWNVDFIHNNLSFGQPYKMLTVREQYTRQILSVELRQVSN